jgi:hypothetical protein
MYALDILIPKDENFEEVQEQITLFLEEDLGMDSLLMTTYNAAEMCQDVLKEQFPHVTVRIRHIGDFRSYG